MNSCRLLVLILLMGLSMLVLLFSADAETITAQEANQDSQQTQQPVQPKPRPTPSLTLKRQLEINSSRTQSLTPPSNDDFDAATFISNFPFAATVDTLEATVSGDDPDMGCGIGTNSNTVWYAHTATANGRLTVETFGSNYDTVLAAFTGSRGALTWLGCNDDDFGSLQSYLEFSVVGGETYYIEVADYGGQGGGQLHLTVDFTPRPVIDIPLDIVLVQDETGSMIDDIGNLRALAPDIWTGIDAMAQAGFRMGVVGVRDYAQSHWGDIGDWVYRLPQDLTSSSGQFTAAANSLTAGGGNDGPESQYAALYYLLTPSHPCIDSNGDGDCLDFNDTPTGQQPSFAPEAKRVILLATDAPFHDPDIMPGYPGPNRDAVVNALLTNNVTIIGLVPGGAGTILQVDDLAEATGGSVENTGSSGQAVAEAIARAIGEFGSEPGTQGSLSLTASPTYETTGAILADVQVGNPTDASNTYTVIVSLRQSGTSLDIKTQSVTVSAGSNSEIKGLNFGIRPAGSYQLWAELWLDSTLLQTQGPLNIQVALSEDQEWAISEAAKLKEAAYTEFDEIREIVVPAYADSISELPSEIVSLLLHGLLGPLDNIAEYADIGAGELIEASSELTLKLLGVEHLLKYPIRETVEQNARAWLDESLAPERALVQNQANDFNDYIASQPITWDRGRVAAIVAAHEQDIRGRTEWETFIGIGAPPTFLMVTTLEFQAAFYSVYKGLNKLLSLLVIAAALGAIIVAVVGTAGVSIPALAAGAVALSKSLWLWLTKPIGALLLVLLALVMHIQSERIVAPAVTREHNIGLTALRALSAESFSAGAPEVNTQVQVVDQTINIKLDLEANELFLTETYAETYIYAADGHIVDIFEAQLRPDNHQAKPVSWQTYLEPGDYKAITVAYAGNDVVTGEPVDFTVNGAQVELNVQLADAQLDLSEPLEATLTVTNIDPTSSTGDVTLLAMSASGDAVETWTFTLAPGASTQRSFEFIPQSSGPGLIRVSVFDVNGEIVFRDAPYIVGTGAAVGLNFAIDSPFLPGEDVSLSVEAFNAGTQPSTSLVSFTTISGESGASVHTEEISLNLGAEAEQSVETVILPSAPPGNYMVVIELDSEFYGTLDFLVTAEDSLFAGLTTNSIQVAAGETIELYATVLNSALEYVDATVVVALWQPDGVIQSVVMNHVGTGQYQGTVTPSIAGTYLATADVSRPGHLATESSAFFTVDERSQLRLTMDGRPILGMTRPVTITVNNELNTPIINARVTISSTNEYVSRQTNELGEAVFHLSPTVTETYKVSAEKVGFSQTLADLPIWIAPDVTPPALFVDVPSITNNNPVTVRGSTEAGVHLDINGEIVTVDDEEKFITTLNLSEGNNSITATATDAANNATTLTKTVTLDRIPPSLTVTHPPEGFRTSSNVINVSGTAEIGSVVTVNDTLASVDPNTGNFNALIALQPGENVVSIRAIDAAGNTRTVVRRVNPYDSIQIYLPIISKR